MVHLRKFQHLDLKTTFLTQTRLINFFNSVAHGGDVLTLKSQMLEHLCLHQKYHYSNFLTKLAALKDKSSSN